MSEINPQALFHTLNVAQKKIAIDGVFFNRTTGIARLWINLLKIWNDSAFSQLLIIIDRDHTAPQFNNIQYINAQQHNYHHLNDDRHMLQQICDTNNICLFTSTYYSTPLKTASTLLVLDMIPERLGFDLNDLMWQEKKHAIDYAKNYISISHNTTKDLIEIYPQIPYENVLTSYCGTTFKKSTPEIILNFKKKYGIEKKYFLLSGGRYSHKNLILFFNAFSLLGEKRKEYSIVFTNSDNPLHDDYKPYIGDSSIHYVSLTQAELEAAYTAAIALIYPSLYEGFGLPVLEAMACECPVITCKNSSIPEIAGETAAIYVDPFDPHPLAQALQDVEIDTVRASLIHNGIERANIFSWEKMALEVQNALLLSAIQELNT